MRQGIDDNLDFDPQAVADFCRRWKVTELSVFGSVLRNDFGPGSDVDVLVELEDDWPWSLYEWVEMIDELRRIFGREVDLVDKTAIRNPFRRHRILNSYRTIYAA